MKFKFGYSDGKYGYSVDGGTTIIPFENTQDATVTAASQILSGYTAYSKGVKYTGTHVCTPNINVYSIYPGNTRIYGGSITMSYYRNTLTCSRVCSGIMVRMLSSGMELAYTWTNNKSITGIATGSAYCAIAWL